MRKFKQLFVVLLIVAMITTTLPLESYAASNNLELGSYNVIGLENLDYKLKVEAVKRNYSFNLNDEKLSFYMLGCDLIAKTDDRMEFVIRNPNYGAKFVFIAPEAGRKSEILQTKNFYTYANSILRVKDVDKIIYQKEGDNWNVILGENDIIPEIWIEEKNGSNEKLKFDYYSSESVENPFIIDLENYTIKREDSFFKMHHVFSPKSLIYKCMSDPTITFKSEEIMLRTFETRLSEDNNAKTYIYVDRKPSKAIIGNVIRLGSNSDDGANLATITGIDVNNNKIHILRYSSINYNTPDEGTWLRCFSDYSNGIVIDNEYPKVYLEPSIWGIKEEEIGKILNRFIDFDPTGLMDDIEIKLDDEDNFGYKLKNVSYSYDGLNFVGGFSGAFDIEQKLNFFGRKVTVGPVHIDYSSASNSVMDQILRINTYKREAFRFYFNPNFMASYCEWGNLGSLNPPDTFPLSFRLYFDKNFELIGGNIKVNIPGKGIPMPGGLIYVDNIGGGFTYPQTFDVSAKFTSIDADFGFPLWNADAELRLSLDRKYLYLKGRSWMFGKKVSVGQFDATVSWSYYIGKHFKGVEVNGETGIGSKHVNMIAEITFKVKKYKSSGKTKTYIGGSGEARVEAFGITLSGIGVYFNSKRIKGTMHIPVIGSKSFIVKYSKIIKNIKNLSESTDVYGTFVLENEDLGYGVAVLNDEYGNEIILIPEAKRIPQNLYLSSVSLNNIPLVFSDSSSNILNLTTNTTEAAITINYEGNIENVEVTLPNDLVKEIVVVDENTIEEQGKLYAMDYGLDDNTRQLYIQIKNAQVGSYTLSYTADNVTSIDIYEIIAVPKIVTDSLNATFNNSDNTVTLDWELEELISGDVRYHLTMVDLESGEVKDEYIIFEDLLDEDDETTTENYIPTQALIINETNISTKIKLNDNLLSGNYAFRIEPVLYQENEDNLYGEISFSNETNYIQNNFSNIIDTPVGLTVDSIGNGVVRVMWEYNPLAYGFYINVIDENGNGISNSTLINSDIDPLTSIYIDPTSGKSFVYQNIGIDSNVFADVLLQNIQYDVPYTFEVTAIQRVPHAFVPGVYYNPVNGYIDLNSIESELNEGSLVYTSPSNSGDAMFVEREDINFYVEIYQEGKSEPLFSANIFEGDTGEIGYSYDLDEDTDIEGLRSINPGSLVLRTNALDAIRLLPDEEVKKIGITVISPTGTEIISIPALDIDYLTSQGNLVEITKEIQKQYPNLSAEIISQIIQVYNSGAFSLIEGRNININLVDMVSAGIISSFEPGRYTISVEAYNSNNDLTLSNFEIVVRDIIPTVFIESVIPNNNGGYTVVGYANGGRTISLNGFSSSVNDGIFEFDITIDSNQIDYSLTDEFGNIYNGILDYGEYDEEPAYTVVFEENGGNNIGDITGVISGNTIDMPNNPIRSGYTFVNWYSDENYNNEWIFNTNVVTDNMILYAKWIVYVSPNENESGTSDKKVTSKPESKNENLISVDKKGNNVYVKTEKYEVNLVFDDESLDGLEDKVLKMHIEEVSKDDLKLSDEILEQIGDMPIFDISLFVDDKKIDFKTDKFIQVDIKFEGTGENHKYVVIYIDDDGNIEILKNSFYNGETIKFKITHLSHYGVMRVDKTFKDSMSHWAKEAIEALATRDIVSGTSDTTFNPNSSINRADFTTIVVKYFGFNSESDDNFLDVNKNMYYAKPIAIAKDLNLITGTGNEKFSPLELITRQDMMVILKKALEISDELNELERMNKSINDFDDENDISNYALDSVSYMVSTGIINGNNNSINPKSYSTRAEVAQMLYNLLEKSNDN